MTHTSDLTRCLSSWGPCIASPRVCQGGGGTTFSQKVSFDWRCLNWTVLFSKWFEISPTGDLTFHSDSLLDFLRSQRPKLSLRTRRTHNISALADILISLFTQMHQYNQTKPLCGKLLGSTLDSEAHKHFLVCMPSALPLRQPKYVGGGCKAKLSI